MSLWTSLRAAWRSRQAADRFADAAWAEPTDVDVVWLARHVTGGDEDHARWELRYLRRALAQLVAERDGLDDRTGVLVSQALSGRLSRDRSVAPERLAVAERQYNQRLSRYRETLRERGGGALPTRLAGTLVQLAAPGRGAGAEDTHLAELVARELGASAERLRETFGVAALPDDVRPSEAAGGSR